MKSPEASIETGIPFLTPPALLWSFAMFWPFKSLWPLGLVCQFRLVWMASR